MSQDPNYLVSDDQAQTWRYGGKLFEGLHGYSPYTKYANNGKDTIHFVATEDHPRNFDNSLYHGYLRGGLLHRTDGSPVAPISTSTNTTIRPWDFTRVYQGGKSNVAWMADMELDAKENPVILFTVQVDGAGLPRGKGGMDHRFHYAHWHDRDGRNMRSLSPELDFTPGKTTTPVWEPLTHKIPLPSISPRTRTPRLASL